MLALPTHSRAVWAALAVLLLMINVAVLFGPDVVGAVAQALGL